MPRIVRLHAFGGPENLRVEEAPFRPLGAGEARLRVEAASVNRDHYTFMSGHQFKGHGFVQPELPSRLGYEAASTRADTERSARRLSFPPARSASTRRG